MTIKKTGEFEFIDRIHHGCLVRPADVLKGIGDDAAVFRGQGEQTMLLTTDMLVERIHFSRKTIGGFDLGRKALAVNLSDIAAMGGTPLDAFVSIAVPDTCTLDFLDAFYRGLKSLAKDCRVNILGGDTTRSKTDLIVNICLTGCAAESRVLYRHTAQKGDVIYATGCLGDSRAGLVLLQHDSTSDAAQYPDLVHAHLRPKAFLEEGRFLATQPGVHAAIDVSDGLSSDIAHIAQQSHVGVRIFKDKIPVSAQLARFCGRFDFDPIEMALAGGEDYVLLVTVSPDTAKDVAAALSGNLPSAHVCHRRHHAPGQHGSHRPWR